MINPRISVVIPITRYEFELIDAMESVFSQSEQDFEVVLVDNHATSGTRIIAKEWERKHSDRVRIVNEPIKGAVSARNRGISESRGEFIALLDSDDRMKPDRLRIQCNIMTKDPTISLVGSWFDEISPDGKRIIKKNTMPQIPRWASILFEGRARWALDPFLEPQTSTFFFRSSIARKIGMFDCRFDPFWLEDTDFAFRLYEVGKVYIVPQSLVEYRVHSEADSLRRIFDFGLIAKHDLFFSVLREKYYQKENRDSVNAFKKLKARWLRETGIKFLANKNGERYGKELIKQSLELEPFNIQTLESVVRMNLPSRFHPRPFRIKEGSEERLPDFINNQWIKNLFSLEDPSNES